jgi:hypothetical protein
VTARKPRQLDTREQILRVLDDAEWHYDEEIDEMELVLPGAAGRPGPAILVGDDVYVRVDPDTSAPLSLIIPGYTAWLAAQPPVEAPPGEPAAWMEIPRRTARQAIREAVASSAAIGRS